MNGDLQCQALGHSSAHILLAKGSLMVKSSISVVGKDTLPLVGDEEKPWEERGIFSGVG